MVERRDFFGLEFDFLAVDDDDHVAFFSSAGYGPLPVAVLDRPEREQEAVEAVEALPIVSEIGHRPVGEGDFSFWLIRVERGLFVYDWERTYGPYRRLAAPVSPVSIDAMDAIREHLGALPRVATKFGESDIVDLAVPGR